MMFKLWCITGNRTCSTPAMIKTHSSANKLQNKMKTDTKQNDGSICSRNVQYIAVHQVVHCRRHVII